MIASLLLISLLILFLIRTPIAIAIGLSSLLAFLMIDSASFLTAIQRLYAGTDSFPLMAVPLFMIAGVLMETGGLSKRLIHLADALVGWLPGGLGVVTVVAAMFFAGISGSAAADTAAVGSILIPAMIQKGYDRNFSSAIQAASGSIGVIIPPSIPMIIFGYLTGTSIGKLFAAGILPGILMGLTLIIITIFLSLKNKTPQSHSRKVTKSQSRNLLIHLLHATPALLAPIIIIGGILTGIFTATESAAIAIFYALFVGFFIYRELDIKKLPELIIDAATISSVIMFIIATASIFSWVMAYENIPSQLAQTLLSLTSNKILLLILINILLLIAGTFLETTAALILFVPVIIPLTPILGIDPIQLGVIIVTNLAIGMLTPPLGICLIVSCGIAGNRLEDISRKIVPFLLALVVDLFIITFWSPLTMFLPKVIKF